MDNRENRFPYDPLDDIGRPGSDHGKLNNEPEPIDFTRFTPEQVEKIHELTEKHPDCSSKQILEMFRAEEWINKKEE